MSRKLGAGAATRSSEPLRVLLADDAVEIRLILRRSLELDGSVEVIGEASNGAEAVGLAAALGPDVVLIDLAMPVMDGLQAIPEIRKRSPDSRIVVLSAFSASNMEEKAIHAGAAGFVSKASGPAAILATLHDLNGRAEECLEGPTRCADQRPPASHAATRRPVSGETAEAQTDDLLPIVSHEIANQLTVIRGFAEMLVDGLADGLSPETARQFADSIMRNARQTSSLLDAVSEVRRLDLGTMELQIFDVDASALVRAALPELAALLGGRRLMLDLAADAAVAADPVRVRQILTHLVSNAATFTPPDSSVAVAVTVDGDRVELSVSDDGPGIPADQQDQLFRKFCRIAPRDKGTGMGLYLARGLARAQGGDLIFVPEDPGCRFVLRLPRVDAVAP